MKRLFIIIITLTLSCFAATAKDYSICSPNGRLCAKVVPGATLTYSLTYDGRTIVADSPVEMVLSDGRKTGTGKPRKAGTARINEEIRTQLYRKSVIRDECSELVLDWGWCKVRFRCYDEGFAWRWEIGKASPYEVVSEKASFRFPEDFTMYASYTHKHPESLDAQFMDDFENIYSHTALSQWQMEHMATLPLMVEAAEGVKMVITESDLVSYPGMFLYKGEGTALKGRFAGYPAKEELGGHNRLQQNVMERENFIARCDGASRSFPWRIVCVSSEDAQMADNDMVYRLARPCPAEEDWTWVKPGKVAWDWLCNWNIRGVDFVPGINTRTYKYFIDFAAANAIEYVILDEGWAVKYAGSLFKVVPEIDLEEIVSYACSKGVGIILWAGYNNFRNEMEAACKHYSSMGVKGFKVDFMDRDDQKIEEFMYDAAEMAAKYRLLVDFHGTHKPTGLQRRFPNVINVEGIFGMEQLRKKELPEYDMVEYDVTTPYIRFVAGFADYTQGAMRNASRESFRAVKREPMSQGTRCRQLAEYVVFDSPLSMLMDSPTNYMKEPDCLEFISGVPTVWDETVVLAGEVAEYIVMARRKGDNWYIGGLTDWTARDIELDLGKIGLEGCSLDAWIDGMAAEKFASDFRRVRIDAGKGVGTGTGTGNGTGTGTGIGTGVRIHMAPGGGFAAKVINSSFASSMFIVNQCFTAPCETQVIKK